MATVNTINGTNVNHAVVIGTGSAYTSLSPSSTSGVPFVSQGSSADPAYSTAVVAGGGTGSTTFNINGAVFSNTTTTGVLQSATLTSGQLLIGGTTTPAAATLTAGTGMSIVNGNNSITLNGTGGGVTWNDQGTSTTMAVNNGYYATAAVTLTLPASPSQGDTIIVVVDTASTVVIQANTGQVIRLGVTASAAAGSATNTARGDSLTLSYRTADTTWLTRAGVGNWIVV